MIIILIIIFLLQTNDDFTKLGHSLESELCSKSKFKSKIGEFKSTKKHARVNSHKFQCSQKYKHIVPKLFDVIHKIKEETGSPGKNANNAKLLLWAIKLYDKKCTGEA